MNESLPPHPFLAPFWRTEGVRYSKCDSLTLNDFTYTLRLGDGDAAELKEQEYSYYDSGLVATRTVTGRWTPVRLEPQKVVLRISGVDAAGKAVERILVLLPDDADCGDVDWGMRYHG